MKSKFNDILNSILNESHIEMSDGDFLDTITRKLREIGNTIADLFPKEARYLISLDADSIEDPDAELGPLKDRLRRD
jgi:hypothetical protein